MKEKSGKKDNGENENEKKNETPIETTIETTQGSEKPVMSKSTAQAYSVWQDKEERERILLEQLPQVRYLARRIHERLPRHVPLDDLVHAGVIGLIDALNKFDTSKHVQFSSYA